MPAKQIVQLSKVQEWEAFLALSQILDLDAIDPSVYRRLESACGRLVNQAIVTRNALILESGLSFFDGCAAPDLALMSLVRKGILQPIPAQAFWFAINLDPAGAQARKTESW